MTQVRNSNTEFIKEFAISEIKEYEDNAKIHPEKQIEALSESINIAQINPLVIDEEGTLIAGHGRLEAHKRRKDEVVPVIKILGLSKEEKNKLRLADNKTGEMGQWDNEILQKLLQEYDDIPGFSEEESARILSKAYESDPSQAPDPYEAKEGKVYKAGNLRIVASPDCEDREEEYDIIFTTLEALAEGTNAFGNMKKTGAIYAIASNRVSLTDKLEEIGKAIMAANQMGLVAMREWILMPEANTMKVDAKTGTIYLFGVADQAQMTIYNSESIDPQVDCQFQSIVEIGEPTEVKIAGGKYKKPENQATFILNGIAMNNTNFIAKHSARMLIANIKPRGRVLVERLNNPIGLFYAMMDKGNSGSIYATAEQASSILTECRDRYTLQIVEE